VSVVGRDSEGVRRLPENRQPFKVISANDSELAAHEEYLKNISKECGHDIVWQ